MRLSFTIPRLARLLLRLAADLQLRARIVSYEAQAAMPRLHAGDTAVVAVGAFAVLFVLALVSSELHPAGQQPLARAKGARQQEEVQVKNPQVPRPLVRQCGPWV